MSVVWAVSQEDQRMTYTLSLFRRVRGARAALCVAAAAAGLSARGALAQSAGPEPMPSSGVTLGSLVQRAHDLGSGTQNGIVIGDKVFYNFSYTGAPLGPASAATPNPAPT